MFFCDHTSKVQFVPSTCTLLVHSGTSFYKDYCILFLNHLTKKNLSKTQTNP
jgi:hypothetical protein